MFNMLAALTFILIFYHVESSHICKLEGAPLNISKGVWPGTDVLLNCTLYVQSVERFLWKKDGLVLSNASLISPLDQYGRHLLTWEGLKLDNITQANGGQYSCVVNKDGKVDEDRFNLRIFAKPTITSPTQMYIETKLGSSIMSICRADGWPTPRVSWYKQGTELNNGMMLYISFVRQQDNGFYMCRANNPWGTDSRTLLLHVSTVQDRPDEPVKVTSSYNHVVAYVSQTVTLRCRGVNVFEKYTVVFWEHNGKQLQAASQSYRFINVLEVEFWYIIRNVTSKEAGNYTCAVQTDRGRDAQYIKLDVRMNAPPLVSVVSPIVQTTLGWQATLSCTYRYVDASKSTMRWLYKDKNLEINSSDQQKINITSRIDGTVEHSLVIRNVTRQRLGCYTCYVNNSYGWNTSDVCVKLLDVSKDFVSNLKSSSQPISAWYTTVPILVICTSLAAFIIGTLIKRKKAKRTSYWGENKEIYKYDVFITFSSKDFDLVQRELIPLIGKHNLKYCIHQRDFEIGKTIVDNMADSVYKSRHILAVLSKNYMDSSFCQGELDIALGRAKQLNDSSLIAVTIEADIDKKCLPKDLRNKISILNMNNQSEKDVLESQLSNLKSEKPNTA